MSEFLSHSMKKYLPLMTPLEVREAAARGACAILPMGSTEANGPHLPIGLDYLVADKLAAAVCDRLDAVRLAPLPYGVSPSLASFPGTVSMSVADLQVQVEAILAALADHGFAYVVVFVNHHPNLAAVEYAARSERRRSGLVVPALQPALVAKDLTTEAERGGDPYFTSHGGPLATALMKHLYPDHIRMDLVGPAKGPQQFRGFNQHSANDAKHGPSEVHFFLDYNEIAEDASMGDVSSVTADFGAEIFHRMIEYATSFVRDWMRTAAHATGGQAHE